MKIFEIWDDSDANIFEDVTDGALDLLGMGGNGPGCFIIVLAGLLITFLILYFT
jgi:hypothetical protein